MYTVKLELELSRAQLVDLSTLDAFLTMKQIKIKNKVVEQEDNTIPYELRLELEKRLENLKKHPEQGIFLEDLKKEVAKQRYGI